MSQTIYRKQHLRDAKTGNPACKPRYNPHHGEHVINPFADFVVLPTAHRCEKCEASKLFSFLSRKAGSAA